MKLPNQLIIPPAIEGQKRETQFRPEKGQKGSAPPIKAGNQKKGQDSYSRKYSGNRSYYKGKDTDEARGRDNRQEKASGARDNEKGNRASPKDRSEDDRGKRRRKDGGREST